ncbi:flagellar hook assembly protein FlgD [Clostridium sp.]|uniref:flagellar hook assembly protein FlgD n=1 Tax=Clostridium sp. TaxID=1506 RepID=UPI0034641B1A
MSEINGKIPTYNRVGDKKKSNIGYKVNNDEESRATDRGTRIVKKGEEMDKNSFLKILSAQLKYQDPTSGGQDSSALVAQMAQFASMEQMMNLNNTVTSLSGNALIGKGVGLKLVDDSGKPVTGIVRLSEVVDGEVVLGVEINNNGKIEVIDVALDDVTTIIDVPDYNMDSINVNMALLQASSMIGKKVEIETYEEKEDGKTPEIDGEGKVEKPKNGESEEIEETEEPENPEDNKVIVTGVVTGVIKENGGINITVRLENGEIKKYPYNSVTKILEN